MEWVDKHGVEEWSKSVQGYTFVLPCVSIGNAAQLAVDVFASTLEMEELCSLRHEHVLPFCGYEDGSKLISEMQLFVNREHEVVVLQLRSDVVKRGRKKFVDDVLSWAADMKFGKILVATSLDAAHSMDEQIEGVHIRLLRTSDSSVPSGGIPSLERSPDSGLPHDVFLPGGGLARQFYLAALEKSLPLAVVSIFTSPGDNLIQAFALASALARLLFTKEEGKEDPSKDISDWKTPASWEYLLSADGY